MGDFEGLGLEIRGLVGKWGFEGVWSKIEVSVEKWWVFLKNGVFVGFWSRNREKVGKSREFDDFRKIGKNREK